MQCQLNDAQEECGLLAMEVEELRGKVDRLTEECQERSDQANEWYKALQVLCNVRCRCLLVYCMLQNACQCIREVGGK